MIGIIGTGAFGTALATQLCLAGRDVILWGRDETQVSSINDHHRLSKYLNGLELPTQLRATSDITQLQACDLILIAVPVQKTADLLAQHDLPKTAPLVLCSKGLELGTNRLPFELVSTHNAPVMLLSGPGFAVDLARGLPTAMTLAGPDDATLIEAQNQLSTDTLRIYRSADMIGVGLCGALKNVYAIGAGAVIGAGLGASARAAFITRAFNELSRFITSQGGLTDTCYGLSGLGDLMLTSTSEKSRNFRFGQALGQGQTFDESVTVEGVPTLTALLDKAKTAGVDLPIAHQIGALVRQDRTVQDILLGLMTRELRSE